MVYTHTVHINDREIPSLRTGSVGQLPTAASSLIDMVQIWTQASRQNMADGSGPKSPVK